MILDKTMDAQENAHFFSMYNRTIVQMEKTTIFSATEVACILMVYHKFARLNGRKARFMTRSQFIGFFMLFFQIHDVPTVQRVAMVMAGSSTFIKPEPFINYFQIIMGNDLDAKIEFVFKVYDYKGDGTLDGESVAIAVDKFFTYGDEEEVGDLRKDMTEFLLLKFDQDRDGTISFEEYRDVIRLNPNLMEFMGTVFPSETYLNVAAYCLNLMQRIEALERN